MALFSSFTLLLSFRVAGETLLGKGWIWPVSCIFSSAPFLPLVKSSVDFNGVFPKLQELEELVPCPLLQSHQRLGFLLQLLVCGKDDPGPFLGFLVARVLKKLLERLLVQALEDVGRCFLARGRVEAVAVDRGAHPQGGRHAAAGRLAAGPCFHRGRVQQSEESRRCFAQGSLWWRTPGPGRAI